MPYIKVVTGVLMLILVASLLMLRARYATPKNEATEAAADQLTTSWVARKQLLAAYEQEQSKLRMAVIKQRKLYQDGEVSKSELVETEQSFISVLAHIQEVRRSLMETEMAIAETEIKEGLLSPALVSADGVQESQVPSAHKLSAPWSLKEAPNIDKYFSQTFGHSLPVSALGQTPTHDRMRFDHRNAMDVALHPDSVEGKALIAYLRRSGVPFIAFRSAAVGASTGAHIHIGRPSRRMAAS
jgi:hypothetical protein